MFKRCGVDFFVVKNVLKNILESAVGLDEIVISHDIDLVKNDETV